jgi:hypothetical protein
VSKVSNNNDSPRDPSVSLSDPFKKQPVQKTTCKGRCAMARLNFIDSPRRNPCAQCGRPIAMPEWIETGPHCTAYLWHCHACDYRFEAVAYFDDAGEEPIAA